MRFAQFAFVALCTAISVAAQAPFEGTIAMQVNDRSGQVMTLTYQQKGDKARYEVPMGRSGENIGVVIDPANNQSLVMLAGRGMYMVAPLDMAGAMGNTAAANVTKPTITRTGKMDTIAGYTCEHVLVKHDDKQTDVCISRALGNFMKMPSTPMSGRGGGGMTEMNWTSELGSNVFPLRATENGRTLIEVTSIKKETLDPSLFTPPAGWQKLDMSGMGRMGRP